MPEQKEEDPKDVKESLEKLAAAMKVKKYWLFWISIIMIITSLITFNHFESPYGAMFILTSCILFVMISAWKFFK